MSRWGKEIGASNESVKVYRARLTHRKGKPPTGKGGSESTMCSDGLGQWGKRKEGVEVSLVHHTRTWKTLPSPSLDCCMGRGS